MTQTIGYWCDECRQKYVRHVCHDGLPCGHDEENAIHVYAKNYSKAGEYVELQGTLVSERVWLRVKPRESGVTYVGRRPLQVQTADGWVNYWNWLCRFPAPVIRAMEARWTSNKYPPRWRQIEQWDPDVAQEANDEQE